MKLFLTQKDFFEFQKEASIKIPRDVSQWEQAIAGALQESHPWLDTPSLAIKLAKKDPDAGAAIGSIVLDEKFVIPITIKDFKLDPLDLYFSKTGGDIKPFNQRNFMSETRGQALGKPVKNDEGASGDMSIWDMTRLPYSGRFAYASLTNPEEVKKKVKENFSVEKLAFVCQSNPLFREVLIRHLAVENKLKKEAQQEDTYEWDLVNLQKMGGALPLGDCYVYTPAGKVPCKIGTIVLDPGNLMVIKDACFGIELNQENPKMFLLDRGQEYLSAEPIEKTAQFDLVPAKNNAGLHAYIVPFVDTDNYKNYVFVGPFTTLYNANGVEKVASASGSGTILHHGGINQPLQRAGDLIILGKDAIKVSLGESFTPLTIKQASLLHNKDLIGTDTLVLQVVNDQLMEPMVRTDRHESMPLNKLLGVLQKEATMLGSLQNRIKKLLMKNGGSAILKKTKSASFSSKTASYAWSVPKRNTMNIACLIKPTTYVKACIENEQLCFKEAALEEEEAKDTIDAILSLDFINNINVDKFIACSDKIASAKTVVANLLLASRIGLDIPSAPLKTALLALDEVEKNLGQLKSQYQNEI